MLALDSQTLSITATCFQYHGYGRRTGLKIRSSQEGVGSSPTFGTIAWARSEPSLIARPRSNIANATGRAVSMLAIHKAQQRSSSRVSVVC